MTGATTKPAAVPGMKSSAEPKASISIGPELGIGFTLGN
jgi:hypothetical protein